jgi:hypothetical protein
MVWAKSRSNTFNHVIYDSSRGAGQYKELTPNANWDEGGSNAHTYGYLTSFDSDGFSSTDSFDNHYFNNNGSTYVAWNWKVNGGTTSSNTDGTGITSTVQANTDAGFSIVTYTGTGSGNANPSVGHGLGVTPQVVLVKGRSQANSWIMYNYAIDGANSRNKYLVLNSTGAAGTLANYWGTAASGGVTSSTFGVYADNQSGNNYLNGTHVAYCFAEKQGYSKFGSYVGNGANSGPFIYLGFKPAFVMIKKSSSTGQWLLFDNARDPSNKVFHQLRIITAAETTTTHDIDFLSNGFKIRDTVSNDNGSGNTFIYMAFAENPFTTSTGVPCTAR